MPRRRMIDPLLWDDHHIGTLSRDNRLFLIGCIGNADDEGRLKGHAAYLKAAVFMYDDDFTTTHVQDIKQSCLDKMAAWPKTHPLLLVPYKNSNEDYLFFPNWPDTQKPSHPSKSKLPVPPPETLPLFSSKPLETVQSAASESPSQVRLGQSSLGKVRLGKVSAVQEDFTKYLDSEKDLTDFVTTTLAEYMPRGPMQVMPVIQKLWVQATGGEMGPYVFDVVFASLKKYPITVLAKSLVKAAKYSTGKTKPANYVQTVFEEQMKEYERNRPP